MFARLSANWVYGGALAGLLLLALAPLLVPALNPGGRLCYLALAAYMLHQYEEHDGDRFRRFVNETVAKGRAGLTLAEVFIINIPGVWGVIGAAMWLAQSLGPGWALIAAWLLLVNAAAHFGQAAMMRRANPGVWTALILFLPLGGWMLATVSPVATTAQQAVSLALALLIHLAIMLRAMRPAATP